MIAGIKTKRPVLLAGVAACLIFGTGAAHAQETAPSGESSELAIDEIIVTATRRAVNVQDVPLTISVIGGGDLERAGASGINDVISRVPGLTSSGNGTWRNSFAIRGIANVGGSFQTVGYYLDETSITSAGLAGSLDLFDLEAVEVLKGPQGTLYGEGSIGGTIRAKTRQPDFQDFEVRADAGVSTTRHGGESWRAAAAVNIPLVTDQLAVRLVASYNDQAGFIDSSTTGQRDINDVKTLNLRGALAAKFSDELKMTLGVMYQDSDGGGDALNNPNPFWATLTENTAIPAGRQLTAPAAFDQSFGDKFVNPTLTFNYDSDNFAVVAATAYFDRNVDYRRDDRLTMFQIRAALGQPPLTPFAAVPLPSSTIDATKRKTKVFSQEVRILSQGEHVIDWLVGGFYRERKDNLDVLITTPSLANLGSFVPPFASGIVSTLDQSTKFKQIAGFGELTWNLSPQFSLTGGLRVFQEKITGSAEIGSITNVLVGQPFALPRQSGRRTDDGVLFKVAAQYKPAEDINLYATVSQGIRPGGINSRSVPAGSPIYPPGLPLVFGQDKTTNYEIGLKSRLFDRALTFNLSAFMIDWKDVQVPFNPVPEISGSLNGGKARSWGLEGELVARPLSGLQLGLQATYNKAKLTQAVIGSVRNPVTGAIINFDIFPDNATLPISPKLKSFLFAEYAAPVSGGIEGWARVEHEHTSSRFPGVEGGSGVTRKLGAYDIVNLSLGVRADKWRVTVYADNAFDKLADLSGGLFFTPIGDVEGPFVNRPRTIGIRVGVDY
jgi:iron complex outermembrane recepter protein